MSSLKIIAVILILILYPIESQVSYKDKCPHVYANGVYSGLSLNCRVHGNNMWDYFIYNKKGIQLEFLIDVKNKRIKRFLKTFESINWKATKLFSTLHEQIKDYGYECLLKQQNSEYVSQCWYSHSPLTTLFTQIVKFNNNTLFVRPSPVDNEESMRYLFAFDKTNVRNFAKFQIQSTSFRFVSKEELQLSHKKQTIPVFIRQIRLVKNLIENLDSVVPYIDKTGAGTGYMLLFHFNNRPRYCFTPDIGLLSDQCKSPEKMETLFSECFPNEISNETDPKVDVPILAQPKQKRKSQTVSSLDIIGTVLSFSLVIIVFIIAMILFIWLTNPENKQNIPQNKLSKKKTKHSAAKSSAKSQ